MGRTSCEICLNAYGGAGHEPPCASCRPELKTINEPYFVLFNYCQDQVIMGPSGPVALDGTFINQAMEEYHIDQDERIDFSLTVRKIGRIIFNAQMEEMEKKIRKK